MRLSQSAERLTVLNEQSKRYELRAGGDTALYSEDFLIQRLGYLEDMLIARSLGDELRKIRVKANLTQSELSQETGVQQNTISQYESGILRPTERYIQGLVQVAGISEEQGVSLEATALRAKYGPEDRSTGSLLRFERKLAHRTIKEVAKQIKISADAYGKMERDIITPSWMMVERIAQVLGSQRLHDHVINKLRK